MSIERKPVENLPLEVIGIRVVYFEQTPVQTLPHILDILHLKVGQQITSRQYRQIGDLKLEYDKKMIQLRDIVTGVNDNRRLGIRVGTQLLEGLHHVWKWNRRGWKKR